VAVRGRSAYLVNRHHHARGIGIVLTGEYWPGGTAVIVYTVPPAPRSTSVSARLARRLTFDTNAAATMSPGYTPTRSGPAAAAVAALDVAMAAQPHYRTRFEPVGSDPFGPEEYQVVPADGYFASRFGTGSLIGTQVQKAGVAWFELPGHSCYIADPEIVLTPEQLRFSSGLGALAARVIDGSTTRTLVVIGYFAPDSDVPYTTTYTIDRTSGLAIDEVDSFQYQDRPLIRTAVWDYTTPVDEITPNRCPAGAAARPLHAAQMRRSSRWG
jgi:hypothetical protein